MYEYVFVVFATKGSLANRFFLKLKYRVLENGIHCVSLQCIVTLLNAFSVYKQRIP